MDHLLAGTSRASPLISRGLGNEIESQPVSESLTHVLKGGLLYKWRRSDAVTARSDPDNPEYGESVLFSSQKRSRPHQRFFWVDRICNTWFLRWSSRRKRMNETVLPLAKIDIMARGDEINYYDRMPSYGIPSSCVIVLSRSSYSLQLAADSPAQAMLWFTGVYHFSIHAKSEYATYFIAGNPKLDAFFTNGSRMDDDELPSFASLKVKNELSKMPQEDDFRWPQDLAELCALLMKMKFFSRPYAVEPLKMEVKRVLQYRNTVLDSLVRELLNNPNTAYDDGKKLLNQATSILAELGASSHIFQNKLMVFDPTLSPDEAQDLMYAIVRQNAVNFGIDESDHCVDVDEYERFLETVQLENHKERAKALINSHLAPFPLTVAESDPCPVRQKGLCKSKIKHHVPIKILTDIGFNWALAQETNSLCAPMDAQEIVNMLRYPMGSFWIASSHNTYLLGDQVGGTATAGALASALIRGCRCIELDIQDGPQNEPILCHSWKSYQLTGSVTLREALLACKESAFLTSKLPVVLSFEVHCSDAFLGRTAEMLVEILGSDLYVPIPDEALDLVTRIPLGCLMQRFLIKGKCPSLVQNRTMGPGERLWQSVISLVGASVDDLKQNPQPEINSVFSINESRFQRLAQQDGVMKNLTDVGLVRVFPAGTRLASTNFCPVKAWSLGVQFVALNYQSCDRSMLLNIGKFSHGFGYMLKPPNLRPLSTSVDEDMGYFYKGAIILKIQVLSATQLPPPPNMAYKPRNYANCLNNVLLSIRRGGKVVSANDVISALVQRDKNVNGHTSRGISPTEGSLDDEDFRLLDQAQEEGLHVVPEEDDGMSVEQIIDAAAQAVENDSDILCPYVEISLVGSNSTNTHRTSTVNYNSFQPIWSNTSPPFQFVVTDPNEAILLIHVRHFDNLTTELVGQAAFPVARIKSGIRWAQLLDAKFKEIECCGLLLQVEIHSALV